jgi:hypothetical protein
MSEVEEFYRAEAEYWRAEANRVSAVLRALTETIETTTVPGSWMNRPEPPVGTRFYSPQQCPDVVEWIRHDDGWHCSHSDMADQAMSWAYVVSSGVADWRRVMNPRQGNGPAGGHRAVSAPTRSNRRVQQVALVSNSNRGYPTTEVPVPDIRRHPDGHVLRRRGRRDPPF